MKTSKIAQLSAALALFVLLALALKFHLNSDQRRTDGTQPSSPNAAPTTWAWSAQVLLLAGDGHVGQQDGPVSRARFSDPYGLAQDRQGRLYVSDAGENNRIRRIGREGEVSTWAGSTEGFKDGHALSAQFNTPSGLALDAQGNLYVADTGNHAIRKVTPEGQVSTLAGTGQPGFRDGPAAQAQFNGPLAVAVDAAGRVLVADSYNDRIRVITPDGQVGTLAGGEAPGYQDGPGLDARFDTPSALALDAAGQLWIADARNDAIRKLDASGMVSTVLRSDPKDDEALLRRPLALALTHDGVLYVAMMSGGTVLQIAPDGQVHVLLGKTGAAPLSRPTALLLDGPGLLLSDATSRRIHRIQPAAAAGVNNGPVGPAADAALPDTRQRWPLQPQLAWHEVVGTPGEVRGDGQGAARDHLHAGLDVRGDVGATVLAMADAKVASPLATWGFGGLNEGLSLDGLSYVHMRVGRSARGELFDPGKFQLLRDAAGKPERMRVRRGTRFHAGEALGSINGMAHVHLNLGAPGYLRSPFALGLTDFIDRQPPHIVSIALITAKGERLKQRERGRLLVPRDAAGGLQIVVEAWDQVDGNEARRRLGLQSLSYQLLKADGQPAPGFEQPRSGIDFSRLPFSDDAARIAYAEGSGITVHGSKQTRFLYQVANTVKDGAAVEGHWLPGELAAGDYTLRIFARDHAGNLARQGTELDLRLQ